METGRFIHIFDMGSEEGAILGPRFSVVDGVIKTDYRKTGIFPRKII